MDKLDRNSIRVSRTTVVRVHSFKYKDKIPKINLSIENETDSGSYHAEILISQRAAIMLHKLLGEKIKEKYILSKHG